ncbi:MAG TPA: hypothetical protein PKY51_11310, partial [Fimbriimonadaceae bacterium]|nr:hypothetical protein [Fimbriimonadaceae bacterium]
TPDAPCGRPPNLPPPSGAVRTGEHQAFLHRNAAPFGAGQPDPELVRREFWRLVTGPKFAI